MNRQAHFRVLIRYLKKAGLEEGLIEDRRTLVKWFQEHASDLADLTMDMLFDPKVSQEIIKRIEEALKKITS